MSKRNVSLLAVALALVIGAIVLLLPGQTGRETMDNARAAVPGLEAVVNDIDRIEAIGAGEQTLAVLERAEDGWSVAELSGYAADLEVVRDVLGGLAQAQVLEPKTDNPDYYARLGVEAVSAEDASGVRLDLSGAGEQFSVIVGKEAPARGGHYLRLAASAGSVLADFEGDVPETASAWANNRVVDLMAGELAEVQIVHPDGKTVTAKKVSADETDFSLVELPEGRELVSAWSINSLGSALSTLDFEGVRRADTFSWEDAIALRAVRFDGLEVEAALLRIKDEQDGEEAAGQAGEQAGDWLRLRASAPVPESSAAADTAAEAAPVNGPETPDPDVLESAMAAVAEEAETINARVSDWAYRIPAFKADAMDKRLEDLLRELTEDDSTGGDS